MNKISFFIILSIMAITSSNLKEPALIGDNNFIEAFDKEYIAIKEFLIPFSKAFRDNPQKILESKMNVLDEIDQNKLPKYLKDYFHSDEEIEAKFKEIFEECKRTSPNVWKHIVLLYIKQEKQYFHSIYIQKAQSDLINMVIFDISFITLSSFKS